MALPENLLIWLAVVLAAVQVTLAVLAIVVAVLAVFGRRAVVDSAKREARRAAEDEVKQRLRESNLRGMIVSAVEKEGNILYNDLQTTTGRPEGARSKEESKENK